MKHYKVTGHISAHKRMPSSINGNPRFRGFIQAESGAHIKWRTEIDSACGYEIKNYLDTSKMVTMELDGKGNLIDVVALIEVSE